jgi:hypothetical protein
MMDVVMSHADVDVVTIRDIEGREYQLKCALPARRQAEAFRALARLVQGGLSSLETADASGAGLVSTLVRLLGDQKLVEELGRSFGAAFPGVAGERDPLDVFGLEEMVAALAPLVVRMLKRSGIAFGQLKQ